MGKDQSYGSRFLYAEDLLIGGEFVLATAEISEVHEPGTLKSADGRSIDKWTVSFKGKAKMLVLCNTNVSVIHYLTGCPVGADWIGKAITLQARVVQAFGSDTTAIRVVPPVGTTMRKAIVDRLGKKAVWKNTQQGK